MDPNNSVIKRLWCINPFSCPVLANSVDPDQLASDLDLHCLSLNMWISIKNPDRVIWLARNYKWACQLNLFRTTRVKGLDTAGRFSAICYKEGIFFFFFFFYFLFTIMHTKFFVCFFLLFFLFCFVLRFYGPVNPMGSCLAWSVYLNTLLLDRFIPLIGNPVLCTFLRQKLTTALLESAEGRERPKKIVHDQSPRKKVPT